VTGLPDGFVAGFTWGFPGRRDEWATPEAAVRDAYRERLALS
jgi:hypothetical protein